MHPLHVPGAPVGTWSIPLGCQEHPGGLETPVGSWSIPQGDRYPVGCGWAGWDAAARPLPQDVEGIMGCHGEPLSGEELPGGTWITGGYM